MIKLVREYRFYLSLVLLVFIPILALNTNSKPEPDFNFFDKTIVFVTAPVQAVISYTVEGTSRFLQNYLFNLHLKEDFYALVEENRKLQNVIHNYKEVEAENKRLRALLQFQEKIDDKKIVAQIIARDANSEFRSVRINKGSRSGIEKGMPVVTHEGVVGKVLRTTPYYSDVLTILDSMSSVDSIVQRTRARGVIEGATDFSCILKYALRTDDIEVGDTVVSSGLDGIYPKGLLLGGVTKVNKKNYGIIQEVEVRPSVDFTKLEEVLVILKSDQYIL